MKSVLRPHDRRALVHRLRALAPQTRGRWGRMSAHQMVCHLADTCRVSLGERAATPVGTVVTRTVIKLGVLYLAFPIPRGVPTTRELDQARGGTTPRDFTADVGALEGLLERFAVGTPAPTGEHPTFGPLTHVQWGRFHYRHIDHHLRQFGA
jgi:hypothetical protein